MPHFRRPLMAALAAAFCFLAIKSAMAAPSKAQVESQFQSWISRELWPQAKQAGISQTTFTAVMKTVKLDWSLPDLAPPASLHRSSVRRARRNFPLPVPISARPACRRWLRAVGRWLINTPRH